MEICRGEKAHISGIIRLLRQVGQVHHQGRPDLFRYGAQKYDEAALAAILDDDRRPVFVAVEDDQVLGYGFCVVQQTVDHSVLCDNQFLYIDDICVDEACRGKRVGTAIFRHIQTVARDMGCHSITLNVWAFNEGALAFYRAMGMRTRNITMELEAK